MRNFHDLPPYGFYVYVPETGWESPKYIGLDAAVTEVQRHRVANARFGWPTDAGSVRNFILAFTEARLRSMPGGEAWLAPGPSESPPESFLPRQRSRQALAGNAPAAAVAKKVVAGVALILDWLGSGMRPVEQPLADARASTCARCKFNQPAAGVQKAYSAVADGLHLLLDARAQMKLQTPHDQMLQTCQVCDCNLHLKVFVPLGHIAAHTPKEIYDALWEDCWIRKELPDREALR